MVGLLIDGWEIVLITQTDQLNQDYSSIPLPYTIVIMAVNGLIAGIYL